MMRIGSLCSGVGLFELGLEWAGLGETIWNVEIDPFCRRILKKHWPLADSHDDVRAKFGVALEDEVGRLKKLTQEQVTECVRLYDVGLSLAPIAKYFGISRQGMWELLRRRTTLRPQKRFGEENHFYRGGERADGEAHDLVEEALRHGVLVRPANCSECGEGGTMADGRASIQAHHDDYNKPIDVRWLCQRCHHNWHQANTARSKEVPNEALKPVDLICFGFP